MFLGYNILAFTRSSNKRGFTLIELLVVIAIIGILSTLVIVSLNNSRASARDAKRLNDLKAMANALELYYANNNEYPPSLTPGQSLEADGIVYMNKVPNNPTPYTDGGCANSDYQYEVSQGGLFYSLMTCIGLRSGSLSAGNIIMSPNGLKEDFTDDSKIYFAAMSTPLSTEQQERIDTLVRRLYVDLSITNLSQAFDFFYLHANETPEAALRNLVKRSHDATNINSTTFTQWQGFTGNGSNMHLNTNYNPSTSATALLSNSGSMGVYVRSNNLTDGGSLMGNTGVTNRSEIIVRTTHVQGRLNNTTSHYSTGMHGNDIRGMWIEQQTGKLYIYKNATLLQESSTSVTSGYTTANIFILSTGSNYSFNQVSVAYIGKGLSATEVSNITNSIEWYMDDLGTGVID